MSTTAESHPLFRPPPGVRRRRIVNRTVEIGASLSALLAVGVLLLVIVSVITKALPALSVHLLTSTFAISPTGTNIGGIASYIVGSVILIALASAMAVPLGIMVAIYTTEFADQRVASVIRFALDILNGVPTIITGVFVWGIMVVGGGLQSGWAGAIALAVVELPIVARSAQEVLALVPRSLHEAGLALGLRHWRIVLRIVLPTALGGLITGSILGVARIAGETAPLLFTTGTFSNLGFTFDPSHALPSIPMLIWTFSQTPSPADHAQAWAAALVLISFVLLLSVVARTFHERSQRKLKG